LVSDIHQRDRAQARTAVPNSGTRHCQQEPCLRACGGTERLRRVPDGARNGRSMRAGECLRQRPRHNANLSAVGEGSSPSSHYCETLIRRKSRSNAACLPGRQRRRCVAGKRTASPCNPASRRGSVMIKLENRCSNCGGKFGLVSYHHWGRRFCRRACKANFLVKTARDYACMRRWFGFLPRRAA